MSTTKCFYTTEFTYSLDEVCKLAVLLKMNPSISACSDVALDSEYGPFKRYSHSPQLVLWLVELVERLKSFVSGEKETRFPEEWRSEIMLNYNNS